MPVNSIDAKTKPYKPSQEEKDLVLKVVQRINDLKEYRSALEANPYDVSNNARTIEETWDFCDYVSLPHKYSHAEMQPWMANNSVPMIMAKIDTALAILVSKNPEVEITPTKKAFEKKVKLMEALYNLSWDKGRGRQQLIKFIYSVIKYGFAAGREYHRYCKEEIDQVVGYDRETMAHKTEKATVVKYDEPYFEALPIRDVWIDNRAKPYDEDSIRDWVWRVSMDYSTFEKIYGKYKNSAFIVPSSSTDSNIDRRDKADISNDVEGDKVVLYFYENKEDGEFIITDMTVLLYKGPLLNNELTLVTCMWRIRNDQTIYGLSLPEMLENDQEMLDRLQNMTFNQIILAVGGAGFYSGRGNVTQQDMILEPKLKKLPDAEKITFPKIPSPDAVTLSMLEAIKNEADEVSGVTKALSGEQVGKTLGEAVLNREAGLNRLSLPLNNIEFALERHARLRLKNIQLIYSQPTQSSVVRTADGVIQDEDAFNEYNTAPDKGTVGFVYKFPVDMDGTIYKNYFREERMALEKDETGEVMSGEEDGFMEILPEDVAGDFEIKIRAFSTIPMSKALEESRALETFNLNAKLPYTDIYKAQRWMNKQRGVDPEEIMISKEQIIATQQEAEQARMMQGQAMSQEEGGADTMVPPNELEKPASSQGLSQQVSNAIQI